MFIGLSDDFISNEEHVAEYEGDKFIIQYNPYTQFWDVFLTVSGEYSATGQCRSFTSLCEAEEAIHSGFVWPR